MYICKMSLTNNYSNYTNTDNSFEWLYMIGIGLGVPLIIIIIWYNWAANYRYSEERIAARLMRKYTKPVPDGHALIASKGSITDNIAKANMLIRETKNGTETSNEWFQLSVVENCSPTNPMCVWI